MWIIKGPFGPVNDGSSTRKFLLPSKSYTLGRAKDNSLVIPLKSVSNKNSRLDISEHSLDDAGKIDAIPSLTYTHVSSSKAGILRRKGEEPFIIQKESSVELRDGDFVHLTGAEYGISVHWAPVNVFLTSRGGMDSSSRAETSRKLAKLGIKSSKEWSSSITHLVFKSVESPYSFRILSALVTGSQVVCLKWIEALFQVFDTDSAGASVDIPDSVIQYDHNGFTAEKMDLSSLLKSDISKLVEEERFRPPGAEGKGWSPDANRSSLLDGLRFFILTTDGVPEGLLDVIKHGGGEFRTHSISKDDEMTEEEWSTKLRATRRKPDKNNERTGMSSGLVLIGDPGELIAELGEKWENIYVSGAKSQGLRIIWLTELSECLLRKELAFIDCGKPAASQKSIPPSLPDVQRESALTSQPLRRRTTRASSREPSQHVAEPVPPSTFPDEPSLQEGRKSSRTTQGTSSAALSKRAAQNNATPAPEQPDQVGQVSQAELPNESEPEIQKTVLRRKATTRKKEPSPAPALASRAPSEDIQLIDPPVESSAPRPLKRRVTAKTQKNDNRPQSIEVDESPPLVEVEPPHKKFKFLYEGTQAPMGTIPEDSESHLVEQSTGLPISGLVPGSPVSSGSGRSKRKAGPTDSHDSQLPVAKKRATENQISVDAPTASCKPSTQAETQHAKSTSQSKAPPSSSSKAFKAKTVNGAVVPDDVTENAPDTEPAFLQAMASRTKTKRKEDDFDREFNQLRIAVPEKQDHDAEEQRRRELEAWNSMDLDTNIRGNFMAIEYKDLIRRDERKKKGISVVHEQGLPNFKKFKKKQLGPRSAKVELVLPEAVDFGMGDAYWQQDPNATLGSNPSGASVIPSLPTQPPIRPLKTTQRRRVELAIGTSDEEASDNQEEEEVLPPKRKSRKAVVSQSTKGKIQTTLPKATKPSTRSRPKAKPAFSFDDEEDEDAVPPEEESEIFNMDVSGVDEDDNFSSTFKSTGSAGINGKGASTSRGSQRSTGSKRRHMVLEDSDSDPDAMTFAAFKKNKLGR